MTSRKLHLLVTVFMFLMIINVARAQNFGDNVLTNRDKSVVEPERRGFNPMVRVSLGSYAGLWAPGFNTFGTYVMPEFVFPVDKKFAISVGMGYSALFTSLKSEGSVFNNKPQNYGTLYVSGIYRLTDKITLSATGYKTFDLQLPVQQDKINPRALDMSNEGVAFNLNYKVNNKFEINACFSYDKRNYNPYMMSPFGSPAPFPLTRHSVNPAMGAFPPF